MSAQEGGQRRALRLVLHALVCALVCAVYSGGGGRPDVRRHQFGTPVFLGSRSHSKLCTVFVYLSAEVVGLARCSTRVTPFRYSDEFWGMMLEKALAKYYGGYDQIEGGFVHLALCDMIPGSIGQVDHWAHRGCSMFVVSLKKAPDE